MGSGEGWRRRRKRTRVEEGEMEVKEGREEEEDLTRKASNGADAPGSDCRPWWLSGERAGK